MGSADNNGQANSLTNEQNYYCMSLTQSKKMTPMHKATTTATTPINHSNTHRFSSLDNDNNVTIHDSYGFDGDRRGVACRLEWARFDAGWRTGEKE